MKRSWKRHTEAWKKQIPTLTDEHGMAIDDCVLCDAVGKLSTGGDWQNRWLCLTDGGICRSTDKIGKGKNPYVPFSRIKDFSKEAKGYNGPDIFVIQLTNGGELVYKVLTEDTCPRSQYSRDDWISFLKQYKRAHKQKSMCRELTNAMGVSADGIPGEIQISRTGGIRTAVDVGLYNRAVSMLDSTEARGDQWMDTAFAKGNLGMLKRNKTESKNPWKQRTFCIFERGLAYTSHKAKNMLLAIKSAAEGKFFNGDRTVQLAKFSREMEIHVNFTRDQPGYIASPEISSRRFYITGIVDEFGQPTTWTLQAPSPEARDRWVKELLWHRGRLLGETAPEVVARTCWSRFRDWLASCCRRRSVQSEGSNVALLDNV